MQLLKLMRINKETAVSGLAVCTLLILALLAGCSGGDETITTCSPECAAGQTCQNGTCVTDMNMGDATNEDAEGEDGGGMGTADGGGGSSGGDDEVEPDSSQPDDGGDTKPQCPAICKLPNTKESTCNEEIGQCVVVSCKTGFYDLNRDPVDGCEYACVLTNAGVDLCDTFDNDCNGLVDDGELLKNDPQNCGKCAKVCPGYSKKHTIVGCQEGECVFECEKGYYDNNNNPDDGCESTNCKPTGGETCDGIDNDCDGLIDEDFDTSGKTSCGLGCKDCTKSFGQFAEAECVNGECVFVGCTAGHTNLDGDLSNGCEADCKPTEPPDEICDTIDNDCDDKTADGASDPLIGTPCTVPYGKGICQQGVFVCQYGYIKCVSAITATEETCDGKDNNCDGEIDNNVNDCKANQGCIDGKCTDICTPTCSGRECGDNGCGSRCGECAINMVCQAYHCVPNDSCTPNCDGKTCGPDGCGKTCLPGCEINKICDSSGQCVESCSPLCSGKQCGDNGCGGDCGVCPSGKVCNSSGQCVVECQPDCTNKECGDNGCGSSCANCASGKTCENYKCVDEQPSIGMDSIKLILSYSVASGNTCHYSDCWDSRNVDMSITNGTQTCPPPISQPGIISCTWNSSTGSETTVIQFYQPTTALDGTWDVMLYYANDCYKTYKDWFGETKCYERRAMPSDGGFAKVDLYINGTLKGTRNFNLQQRGDTKHVMRLKRENGYFSLEPSP